MEKNRRTAISEGFSTYTSETSCKRGHAPVRYSSNGVCVECDTKIYAPRRRARNPKPRKVAYGACEHCGGSFIKENNANRHCSTLCRFWSKVKKNGDSGCWEWSGSRVNFGYGTFRLGAGSTPSTVRAHRFSYELAYGRLSDQDLVCHRCDNPSCVNPSHLFLGSHQDNRTDASRKGRLVHLKGSGTAFNDEDLVKVIEMRKKGMSQKAIADSFGVSQATVSSHLIKKGLRTRKSNWDHYCEEKRAAVAALIEAGFGNAEISRATGVTPSFVKFIRLNEGG